jgi:hypothetical protein
MPIISECSSCGSKLTVPENLLDREVKCPRCGTVQVMSATAKEPKSSASKAAKSSRHDDYDDDDDDRDRPVRSIRKDASSETNGAAMGLGIASLVLGIITLPCAFIPLVGAYSIPVSAISLLLGIGGIIVVGVSKKGNYGFPIAGSAVSFASIAVAGLWILVCAGLIKGVSEEAKQNLEKFGKQIEEQQKRDAAEWVDADKSSVTHGDVRIRVSSVKLGPVDLNAGNGKFEKSLDDHLAIRIKIENTSPDNTINYKSWAPPPGVSPDAATLRDNFIVMYSASVLPRPVKGQVHNPQTIKPGQSLEDVLVFQKPLNNPPELRLELPATAFGGLGRIKFRIPAAMIKR